MATGDEAKIADTLFAKLAGLTTSPATTVAWANTNFSGDVPYLEALHLPNKTQGELLGTTKDFRGIFQITVVDAVGIGIIKPSELASQVIAHFPVTLRLGTSPLITFPEPGYVNPSFVLGNEIRLPVTIPYLASL